MKGKKLLLTSFFLLVLCIIVYSQNPVSTHIHHSSLEMDSILKQGPEYDLIRPLVGTWKVVQTIYSKGGEKILARDTFNVERKMIGNFLQEVMQPIVKNENSFTRISYLNYNRVNLRWEYIVLDTRYPVMMFETSSNHEVTADKNIDLYLDAFVLPPFFGKEYTGLLTKEHRVITFKTNDININRQYWTLPAGKEFLAIEYVFKRQ
jgi:hypothetical protein